VRGYLNSLSFPGDSIDGSLELLSDLRAGISRLLAGKMIASPIMCGVRAAQLPLTPQYDTLPTVAKAAPGRFRDTVLFFLTVLDQRSPVHLALNDADQKEARPSVVEDATCDFDPDAATTLVACALDDGVLLSLGSQDRWRVPAVSITMLTASAATECEVQLINVYDDATAGINAERIDAERKRLRFDNWDHLTGGAIRAAQLDAWFEDCRRRPGLEQLIMRTVTNACQAGWRPDGDLMKKLHNSSILEVRAYFNGSNNVRLLFGQTAGGAIAFGFGGLKTSPDWYDHAVPQAAAFLATLS
jgi:hypothetical protein